MCFVVQVHLIAPNCTYGRDWDVQNPVILKTDRSLASSH